MIDLDASALVELVLASPSGKRISGLIEDPRVSLHVPHLADIEVTQVLRHFVLHGQITDSEAGAAFVNLHELDLQRHAHEPLLERVWMLRDNVSAYDAVYVALAEVLNAELLTTDAALDRVPDTFCRVTVVAEAVDA